MSMTRMASSRIAATWSMVKLEKIGPAAGGEDPEMPRQRSVSVTDAGMGDLLRFDAERLRISIERHLLHTGSARARALLDNWGTALGKFVEDRYR